MTYTFKKEEKNGLLNLGLLVLMILLVCLIVAGVKNPPQAKTQNGIFELYLWVGSILSFVATYLSFVRQTSKAKMRWFFVAVTIFMGSLYIGLYQYLTF